ncbi:MAG: T9SS type A sorting domain-containing protein [Bacteroidales bacterium]|nr:T9SS type A sorting domain-containing protein [Bacteroidales bacterium]
MTIGVPVQPFGDIASHTTSSNQDAFEFHVVDTYNGETIEILLTLIDDFGKEWEIPVDFDKPADITNILWESTNESITLSWTPISGEKGYNIYRCDTEQGYFEKLNDQIVKGFSGYTDYGLMPKTIYYYKISCVSNSGIEGNLSEPEETWTLLPYHANWPNTEIKPDLFGGRTEGSPMTADFDADGNKEIYFTTTDGGGNIGAIFGFYHNGVEIYDIDQDPTSYSGFFQYDGAGSSATPLVGDINNDNILEILTTTLDGNGNDKRKIFIHSTVDDPQDPDGYPDLLWYNGLGGPEIKGAVLSDIDNNGSMEILVKAKWGAPLYVLNGSDYSNYPGQWPVDINADGFSMPVAADIDNAGDKEIIIGYKMSDDCDAGIYVFNSNGEPYFAGTNGLFFQSEPYQGAYDRMDSPVTIADIYDDPNNPGDEIICVSGRNVPGNPEGRIFILNHEGQFITNWGYDDHIFSLTNTDPGKAWLPVTSVADVNGDGNIEVLIASDEYIYIWEKDGSEYIDPVYVQGLEAKFIAPLIADVDEDDDMEIVVASNDGGSGIYCYDINGQRVVGWPLRIPGIFSTPCIDDIDNDGKNEIIATSGNEVHVWDTEGDADKIEWGKYRHDRYNSGIYGDFCPKSSDPIIITSVTEWTENHILQSDIYIEPEGKLTIYENVALPEGAKIVVKPGAELVLDGCKLTKACTGNWAGIEVYGDPSSPYHFDQGMLTVKNDAVIEDANVAIRNHHYDPDFSPPDCLQGGIVKAYNSTFKNNNKTFDFRNYSYNSHIYIKDCEFIYDGNYLGSTNPGYFIEIRYMQGVSIYSCDFINNTGASYKGKGIYSYYSQVNIKGKCISVPQPCSEWENSTFVNLAYGIYAMDYLEGQYVDIRHNTFDQCQKGVYISGMDGARVTSNEFWLPVAYTESEYGLYLNNSKGYHIEDNTFEGPSPTELGNIGLYVNYSGTSWNQVYNNTFENLRQATIAYGINRYETETGLCIECNDYENNKNDIVVNGNDPNIHGIAYYQGCQGLNDTLPAGNTFTQHSGLDYNYYNCDKCGFIEYIYHKYNETGKKLNPEPYYSPKTMHKSENPNTTYTKESACPSKLNGNGGSTEDDSEGMADSDTEIGVKEAQLASLVDGGDTDGMNLDVMTSTPPNAGNVYQDLMSQSPFLSDTVMKSAIYKETVLPNAMVRNVLVANPQSAKDKEVLDAIDERFDPMPQWMKNQVLQGVNITGAKKAIESELAKWKQKRGEHFNNLYQYFRKDTINPQVSADSLEMLLTDDPYLISKYRLAYFYYSKQDYSAMNAVLNNIPSGFDLSNTQQIVHQDYLSLFNILEQLAGNEMEVDSAQAVQLEMLAQNDDFFPGAYARDILIAAGLMEYEEPIILPEILKSSEIIADEPLYPSDKPEVLKVFPNPAKDYIIVEYNTEGELGDVFLRINDITGKPVHAKVYTTNRDQVVISTKEWKSGVYLISLSINGKTIESTKVTIK